MQTEQFNVVPTTISFRLATPFQAIHMAGHAVVDRTTGVSIFETTFTQDISEFIRTLEGLNYRPGDLHLAMMVEELWTYGESTAENMLADNFPIISIQ
jgi:hypothetical protein